MYTFSFCLYGEYNPKYYGGLVENLKLINKYFPGWFTNVYVGSDVPDSYIETILKFDGVRIRKVNATGPILMMHRFLAIDEPDVDAMIVRDADSRIHYRDRWAIKEFIVSNYYAHAVRDHGYHIVPMLGGLWGMKKHESLPRLTKLVEPYLGTRWMFGMDQEFLARDVYPLLQHVMLVHTCITYRASEFETHVPFPWAFSEACYCGKAEGNQSVPLLRIFRK